MRIQKNLADALLMEEQPAAEYAVSLVEAHRQLMCLLAATATATTRQHQAQMQALEDDLVIYRALVQERWPDSEGFARGHST